MLGDLWQGQVHRNYCGIFVQCIRWIFKTDQLGCYHNCITGCLVSFQQVMHQISLSSQSTSGINQFGTMIQLLFPNNINLWQDGQAWHTGYRTSHMLLATSCTRYTNSTNFYPSHVSEQIINRYHKDSVKHFFMEIEDTLRNLTVTEIFLIPSKCTGKMKKTKRKKIFLWNHKQKIKRKLKKICLMNYCPQNLC